MKKASSRNESLDKWLTATVIVLRMVVGATFIFSGFVKAVDPYGLAYKLQDYFVAFGVYDWGVLSPKALDLLSLPSAVLLAAFEFILGVYTFFGSYRRVTPWLLLAFMAVMTPLTLYLAIADPVHDCGCFGEALILTNWQTFGKNLFLLAAVVVLLYFNMKVRSLYTDEVQWVTGFFSLFFLLYISWVGIYRQPILDFRPYKVGTDIAEAMLADDGTDEFVFVYEKEGKRAEFTLENLPDAESGWTFVERHARSKSRSWLPKKPGIEDFSVFKGEEEVTLDLLEDDNYSFWLLLPDIEYASDAEIDKINELYDYSREYGYRYYCLTAGASEAVQTWCENTGAEYPVLFMDRTTLRTIARGNPVMLVMKSGVIYHKIAPTNIPDETHLDKPWEEIDYYGNPDTYSVSSRVGLLVAIYLFPMLFLLMTEKTVVMIIHRVRYVRRRRFWKRYRALRRELHLKHQHAVPVESGTAAGEEREEEMHTDADNICGSAEEEEKPAETDEKEKQDDNK